MLKMDLYKDIKGGCLSTLHQSQVRGGVPGLRSGGRVPGLRPGGVPSLRSRGGTWYHDINQPPFFRAPMDHFNCCEWDPLFINVDFLAIKLF